MNFLLYGIILASGITNIIADVLLQSGRDYSNPKQSEIELLRATKTEHFLISAILGALSITCWQAPLFLLMKVKGGIGICLQFSFVAMISLIAVFHVACCMAFHICKVNEDKLKEATKYLTILGPLVFIPSLIYTATMIYAGATGLLHLSWFHYLTLPLPAVILIQFGLGKLLKRVPYIAPTAGTISMVVSLMFTINIFL